MKSPFQKFYLRIRFTDESNSNFSVLKLKVISHLLNVDNQEIIFPYQNLIQQSIVDRAKRTAFKLGCLAYVADYEERSGSFKVTFLLIIETMIIYAHLRDFVEIIQKDITSLFGESKQFNVRSEITEVPNPIQHDTNKNHGIWARIGSAAVIAACLSVALVYYIFRSASEKTETAPTEIIIKTDNGQPLIKGMDDIII